MQTRITAKVWGSLCLSLNLTVVPKGGGEDGPVHGTNNNSHHATSASCVKVEPAFPAPSASDLPSVHTLRSTATLWKTYRLHLIAWCKEKCERKTMERTISATLPSTCVSHPVFDQLANPSRGAPRIFRNHTTLFIKYSLLLDTPAIHRNRLNTNAFAIILSHSIYWNVNYFC